MNDEPLISIVVCTHNRAELLSGVLNSLGAQTLARDQFEILVVDNNSDDQTLHVATEFAVHHSNVLILSEAEQGLSHARNTGWREARGKYVAYIDDDAEADSDWLAEMALFISRYPDVVAFGGPYDAFSKVPVPDWFPPEEGTMSLGSSERPLDSVREFIYGTNMVFLRETLASLGGFDPALGMKGNKVFYGEETRLQLLIKERGHAVFHAPRMKVRHLIPAYKMSLRWLLNSAYASGRCSALAFDHRRGIIAHFAGIAYGCVYALRMLCRCQRVPVKRLVYYALTPLVSEVGALVDYFSRYKIGIRD